MKWTNCTVKPEKESYFDGTNMDDDRLLKLHWDEENWFVLYVGAEVKIPGDEIRNYQYYADETPITTVAPPVAGLSGEAIESNAGYTTVEGHLPPVAEEGGIEERAKELYPILFPNATNHSEVSDNKILLAKKEGYIAGANSVRQQPKPDPKDDPFIKKHLAIIREKTIDSLIEVEIKRRLDLLKPSIDHFLSGGNISGEFYLTLKKMLNTAYNWKSHSIPQPGFVEQLRAANPYTGEINFTEDKRIGWERCCDQAHELLRGKEPHVDQAELAGGLIISLSKIPGTGSKIAFILENYMLTKK